MEHSQTLRPENLKSVTMGTVVTKYHPKPLLRAALGPKTMVSLASLEQLQLEDRSQKRRVNVFA